MPEIFTIKPSDLVLKVSENVDPARFDVSKYEAFLDALWDKGISEIHYKNRSKISSWWQI